MSVAEYSESRGIEIANPIGGIMDRDNNVEHIVKYLFSGFESEDEFGEEKESTKNLSIQYDHDIADLVDDQIKGDDPEDDE
jgi:hypothetical protein